MEIIDGLDNVRNAWGLASSKGYFNKAILEYTAPDFVNFIIQLLPGLLIALLIPIAGQVGGTAAGTAVGAVITAFTGQAEVIPFTANIGRVIGGLVANAALVYMGLRFLIDFIGPRVYKMGEHIGKGCQLAYNQPPDAGERLLDAAAIELAEGIGYFMGLLLMAIVMYAAKGPMNRMAKLRESYLGRTCPKVMEWVSNNLNWLVDRYKAGPTKVPGGASPPPVAAVAPTEGSVSTFEPKVIEGGVDPRVRTDLQNAKALVNRILPFLVGRLTRSVAPSGILDLDAWLTKFGFRLVRAEAYGPNAGTTGWQLFWQAGNVLIRFKTTGENAGPRAGKPHMSIGYNDGAGLDWQNDMAKFTFDGKLVAKVITDPAKFNPTDFQGNPQKFVLLPTNFDISAVDAWAARTHFNADSTFSLDGLQKVVSRAGH